MEELQMNDVVSASPPEDDGAAEAVPPNPGHENHQHALARRNTGQILTRDQCLVGISYLPGLLAIGMLKPPTSNSMLAAYNSLLHQYERSGQLSNQPQVSNEDVLQAWRQNPMALRMVEPFLTDDQRQMILQNEAGDGQA
jgi:hypothetical protein